MPFPTPPMNQMQPMGPGASGPMPTPPGSPSLTAFPLSDPSSPSKGMAAAGGIPRMGFQIEQSLDDLARVAPSVASEIDQIKGALKGVIAKILQGGAPAGNEPDEDEEPTASPSGMSHMSPMMK